MLPVCTASVQAGFFKDFPAVFFNRLKNAEKTPARIFRNLTAFCHAEGC